MTERESWLDWIRAVGAFAIIILHVTAREKVRRAGNTPDFEWWTLTLFEVLTRIAVPLFFLISGYLTLHRFARGEHLRYALSKAARLLGISLFWTITFSVWEFVKGYPATPIGFVGNVFAGHPYYHLWFLYAIAGCYLVTPFLVSGMSCIPSRYYVLLGWVIPLLFAMDFALGTVQSQDNFFRSSIIALPIPYTSFVLSGYLLTAKTSSATCRLGWASYTAGFIGSVVLYVILLRQGVPDSDRIAFFPFSPLVVFMSLGAFTGLYHLSRSSPFPTYGLIQRLARDSMGIYLLHPFVLDILNHIGMLGREPIALVGIPMLSAAVLLATWASVLLARQLPFLRRTVML